MFVCLCNGVSDKVIKKLKQDGVSSVKEIQRNCRAGADCGACIGQIRGILEEDQQVAARESQSE